MGEVNIPLCTTNRINSPETADQVLADGKSDLVSMARPLLADPHFMKKAAEGRAQEINTCIGCNQACLDFTFKMMRASETTHSCYSRTHVRMDGRRYGHTDAWMLTHARTVRLTNTHRRHASTCSTHPHICFTGEIRHRVMLTWLLVQLNHDVIAANAGLVLGEPDGRVRARHERDTGDCGRGAADCSGWGRASGKSHP